MSSEAAGMQQTSEHTLNYLQHLLNRTNDLQWLIFMSALSFYLRKMNIQPKENTIYRVP